MSRTQNGAHVDAKGRKTFIPLENNPAVFDDLAHRLGLSKDLAFYDIYSLADPRLVDIPRPIHVLIFIAPAPVYHRVRAADPGHAVHADEFKQTIGNACGFLAFLHGVLNGSARDFVQTNSALDTLRKDALPLKPRPRAQLLHDSVAIEEAHMSCAERGDTAAPEVSLPAPGYHFIPFVKGTDEHLYELEGSWDGPIDRGLLDKEKDCLSETAVNNGPGKFVKAAEGNMEFSIIALAGKNED